MLRALTSNECCFIVRQCCCYATTSTASLSNPRQYNSRERTRPRQPRSDNQHGTKFLKSLRSYADQYSTSESGSKIRSYPPERRSWNGSNPRNRPGDDQTRKYPATDNFTLDTSKLLQPHVLSQRVKDLAKEDKLDDAIELVKTSPLDASNVQVWNTLIWETNRAARYSVAWKLFNDMKRRGFEPSTYSYKTMLNGLSRIDDFQSHSLALERAHKLYQSFLSYISKCKSQRVDHPELWPVPIHFYIAILSKAGLRQQMWDVFYSMDKEGPMSPDASTFTEMFKGLQRRGKEDSEMSQQEWDEKVGSQTALLWRLMVTASDGTPGFKIDSHAISAALRLLAYGRAHDQKLAFDIVQDYLGLRRPEEDQVDSNFSPLRPKVELNCHGLQAALDLCSVTNQPATAIAYGKQVMASDKYSVILDIHNMTEFFNSYFKLSAPSSSAAKGAADTLRWLVGHALAQVQAGNPQGRFLWPAQSTYNLVLASCRECGDWEASRAVFELMSGHQVSDLIEASSNATSGKTGMNGIPMPFSRRPRAARHLYNPTPESFFSMMRSATASSQPSHSRECLQIILALGGPSYIFSATHSVARKTFSDLLRPKPVSADPVLKEADEKVERDEKRRKYWVLRAASAVPSLVRLGLQDGKWDREGIESANQLKMAALEIMKDAKRKAEGEDESEKRQVEVQAAEQEDRNPYKPV